MKLTTGRIATVVAVVTSLTFLAAPGAFASGHAAAGATRTVCTASHVTVIATHRTKTSSYRAERVTEPVCRRVSASGAAIATHHSQVNVLQGECTLSESIGLRDSNKQIFARAWLSDCTFVDTCHKFVTIQQKEDSPQQSSWEDVTTGKTTSGCVEADYAWVDGTCYTEPTTVFSYRPRGAFTILWDDGEITQPVEYGGAIGGYRLACG